MQLIFFSYVYVYHTSTLKLKATLKCLREEDTRWQNVKNSKTPVKINIKKEISRIAKNEMMIRKEEHTKASDC